MGIGHSREASARAGHSSKPRIKEVPPRTEPTWPRFLAGLFFGTGAIQIMAEGMVLPSHGVSHG